MKAAKHDPDQLSEGRPWWRHRWPWLLLLGPAVVVVGCAVTVFLAFQAYGSQEIHDGGTRHGLVVTAPTQNTR
ncbi:hypothetical protein [Castellaniella caeni]|uniref:hypothetical protein n=1 Tax=Castellaniella caeni TaxID=266123 RepID=UPI00082BBAF3|nr:hypothetical protein [Castellaniella caeni]